MKKNRNKNFNIDLKNGFSENLNVHQNLSQDVIITTVDKLKLLLIENKECLKSRTEWIAPIGIFIALITTLITTDFKESLGLKPEVWQAIFIISSILCFLWFSKSIYTLWRNWKNGSIETIIDELKIDSEEESNSIIMAASWEAELPDILKHNATTTSSKAIEATTSNHGLS